MAKITVKCNICDQVLIEVEGPALGQNEVDLYKKNCSCHVDGPLQTYDVDGNPLPMDSSNIVATISN